MAERETNVCVQPGQGTSLGRWTDELRCYVTAISENSVEYTDALTEFRLLSDMKTLLHDTQ